MTSLAVSAHFSTIALGAQLLAESSSSSGEGSIYIILAPIVLGLLVGFSVYTYVFLRYRNTDKSYQFEQETAIGVSNVQVFDTPTRRIDGVRSPTMSNRNNGNPRTRVRRIDISE